MLTRIWGYDEQTVQVSSTSGTVQVHVESDADGLPSAPLSKEETHDALVLAKAKAENFIAAVERDIDATSSHGKVQLIEKLKRTSSQVKVLSGESE